MTPENNKASLDSVAYNDSTRADWRSIVDKQLLENTEALKLLRDDLLANTSATQEARAAATEARASAAEAKSDIAAVKTDTGEVVELLRSFKGAFAVLNMFGKLAKPLAYIAMLGSSLWGVLSIIKGGGDPPR